MSLERAKKDLRKQLIQLEAQAGKVRAALVALGGVAMPVMKNSATKALKQGVQRSAAWRKKISIAAKKRWAAVRADKAKTKKA